MDLSPPFVCCTFCFNSVEIIKVAWMECAILSSILFWLEQPSAWIQYPNINKSLIGSFAWKKTI